MRKARLGAVGLALVVAATASCDRLGDAALRAGATAAIAGVVALAEVADAQRAARQAWTPAPWSLCPNFDCYVGPDVSLEEARDHVRRVVDEIRALNGVSALDRDFTLDVAAQSATKEVSRDHQPHLRLLRDPASCPKCGESQSDPGGYPAGPVLARLDAILDDMMHETGGGTNRENLLRGDWHRVGIGIVNAEGPVYLTLDLAP